MNSPSEAPSARAATLPQVIQGGMGVAISGWRLARAVSRHGQLGVVSGTSLDNVLVRRLQDGDPDGDVRRAMAAFPLPGAADAVLARYFIDGGRDAATPYLAVPMYRQHVSHVRQRLTMLAAFVEVWLAREGHDGVVGINLLTKVQLPNLATLYGAMLAGVDCVLMGAGIPKEIPGVLDAYARHEPARMRFEVEGLERGESEWLELDPREHLDAPPPQLKRPIFLPIVSSSSLATMLARKANGRVDGFIIEGAAAGGHNAPPRGTLTLNERGEPLYGERDLPDLAQIRELGLPFWLAGAAGSPEKLAEARAAGAAGIQVGTLFAYCAESGMDPVIRRRVLHACRTRAPDVFTDPLASPTGFPFKVVGLEGTLSEADVFAARERVCDLGYLRNAYRRPDGRIGYRCAAEPVDTFLAKGGDLKETVGRKCLCNALMADVGLAQVRAEGALEPPLITSGDELAGVARVLAGGQDYSASDVLDFLLAAVPAG